MNLRHIWMTCWLLLALAPAPQAQVRFEATANAKEMLLSGEVEVSFTLYDASGKNFTPPDFNGFKVLAGPFQSSSTSLVNGVRSSQFAMTFVLRPQRKGVLSIGSASVVVNRKTLYTKPIQISVVEGSPNAAEERPAAFLKAEIDKTTAYPGQQLLLDYKIYIQPQYFKQGHQVEDKPDYAGFFAEQLNYYRSYQEVVNGVEYVSATLARIALFPQLTGQLEIPPLRISLDIGSRRSGGGIGFGFAPIERLNLESNSLSIDVRPFPEGAPPSFTGACGKYTFRVSANRKEMTTDDALSITIFMEGDGDIKQVGSPVLMGVDSFEVFDPKILSENITDSNEGYFSGEKAVEYLLTPRKPGLFEIPMQFSYWDPDTRQYVTADQEAIRIEVRPGSGRPALREASSAGDEGKAMYPLLTGTQLQNQRNIWVRSPLFWTIAALPLFGWLGFFLYRRRQTREERLDPALVQERRIRRVVDQHLSAARTQLQSGNHAALFEEVSRALGAYLRHKLGIPPARWTKDRVSEELSQAGAPPEIVAQVREALLTCEIALYSGQDKQEAAQRVFDQASAIILQMEKK